MKIGLIGSPGTGRSTCAELVEKEYGIPFLSSRSMVKPIIDRDGYDYTMRIETFLSQRGREIELINNRIKAESEMSEFVTDRTTLENFVYVLLHQDQYSEEDLMKLSGDCRENLKNYTHIFYFPWAYKEIVANGLRTTDKWYQLKVDCIIKGLLKQWSVPHIELSNVEDIREYL